MVTWKNHGQYVRCVARATAAVVKASSGAPKRRCVKDSVRCAARSTCGRPDGVVNCTIVSASACTAGPCGYGSPCAVDADCAESSCSFRPSAAECVADGGIPGTGSCCAPVAIGSPSGAFVDGVTFY